MVVGTAKGCRTRWPCGSTVHDAKTGKETISGGAHLSQSIMDGNGMPLTFGITCNASTSPVGLGINAHNSAGHHLDSKGIILEI
jgi:hypothetical protein